MLMEEWENGGVVGTVQLLCSASQQALQQFSSIFFWCLMADKNPSVENIILKFPLSRTFPRAVNDVRELELWFQRFLSLASDGVDWQVLGSVHYKCSEIGIRYSWHWGLDDHRAVWMWWWRLQISLSLSRIEFKIVQSIATCSNG
jgi:hypothetical protein